MGVSGNRQYPKSRILTKDPKIMCPLIFGNSHIPNPDRKSSQKPDICRRLERGPGTAFLLRVLCL